MSLISDNDQNNKLKQYKINIKTRYIVGNKILERNTDNSINDDIESGIRFEKMYYVNNILSHTEKDFDSRIEYTFISKDIEDKEYTCPNCGMTSRLKDFLDGCPYCKTYYNIEYTDKDLGSKYHYDRVLKSNIYRIVTAIIDILISFALSFMFIKMTSRTFNNYDITKVFVYGIILALILYYFFYIIDAYVVLGPIKKYKDRQNQKQIEFWKKTNINKKVFFNNLNYEVRKYYYAQPNIIDYDVLDYLDFKDYVEHDELYVEVLAHVRIVLFNNNKIISRTIKDRYLMKKHNNGVLELKTGANIIKCSNCGASISATKGECDYCHTKINHLQEWVLETKK